MTRAFADTNWLTPLYFDQGERTRVLRSWTRKHSARLWTSRPVLLEAQNVFARLAKEPDSAQWKSLSQSLGRQVILSLHSWVEIASQAQELATRYAHKSIISTADFLVVASAYLSGATFFLSFDEQSGCRALASVLKMSVYPELTETDKRIAALLKA